MSLIYNTLEKIESDRNHKKPDGKKLSKKKTGASPASLIILAIVISAVIYAVYSGIDSFNKKKTTKKKSFVHQKTSPVVQEVYTAEMAGMEEAPEIPDYELTMDADKPVAKGSFSQAIKMPDRTEKNTQDELLESATDNQIQSKSNYANEVDAEIPESQYHKTSSDIKQLNKTTRIINIVSEINKELHDFDDERKVNRLIKNLKKLSGEKNNYALKIEAVIQMKKKNYTKAEAILKEIKTNNTGDDREIKINLAIIELNTGRISEAKNRLNKLSRKYPEDDTISQLLKQCKFRL